MARLCLILLACCLGIALEVNGLGEKCLKNSSCRSSTTNSKCDRVTKRCVCKSDSSNVYTTPLGAQYCYDKRAREECTVDKECLTFQLNKVSGKCGSGGDSFCGCTEGYRLEGQVCVLDENQEATVVTEDTTDSTEPPQTAATEENKETTVVTEENQEATVVTEENKETIVVTEENIDTTVVTEENKETIVVTEENKETTVTEENKETAVTEENKETTVTEENKETAVTEENQETTVTEGNDGEETTIQEIETTTAGVSHATSSMLIAVTAMLTAHVL